MSHLYLSLIPKCFQKSNFRDKGLLWDWNLDRSQLDTFFFSFILPRYMITKYYEDEPLWFVAPLLTWFNFNPRMEK